MKEQSGLLGGKIATSEEKNRMHEITQEINENDKIKKTVLSSFSQILQINKEEKNLLDAINKKTESSP